MSIARGILLGLSASLAIVTVASTPAAAQKKPNRHANDRRYLGVISGPIPAVG
jgi:hypothetical protein